MTDKETTLQMSDLLSHKSKKQTAMGQALVVLPCWNSNYH